MDDVLSQQEINTLLNAVKTGKFAAMMNVALNNDGPVTFVLRTKDGTPV